MILNDFDCISWHDSVISSFAIDFDNSSIFLKLNAYENIESNNKVNVFLNIYGVDFLSSHFDFNELNDNCKSGNISNAYIKNEKIYIYFVDGFLSIRFRKFEIII